MEITISQEQGRLPVTVLHIKGDIDASSSGQLEVQAEEAIAAGTRNLILDLTGVRYLSSAGLRVLNIIFNRLQTDQSKESPAAIAKGVAAGTFKSSQLKLLQPSPRVLEVLRMSGFDMFLEIHHDLKNAVASF
jgi:anti-anti-sigma factor